MSEQYIMVDEFGLIVSAVKAALNLPVLNYQYGYVTELNENLQEMTKSPAHRDKRFPLVWLAQPFSVDHGDPSGYSILNGAELFIIAESGITERATERMADNFKPVIYPIYREIFQQILAAPWCCEMDIDMLRHKETDRYYWGDQQQKAITAVFDCKHIQFSSLKINNKSNCSF